jgi:hypothetical protein
MFVSEDRALKLATPKILTSQFRNGTLEFGSIFAADSPSPRAQRGTRFLKFDTRSGGWRDLFTGTTGNGIVSFVSYGKSISSGAALVLCKKAYTHGNEFDGHSMRPIVGQNGDSDEPDDDATVTKLAKRRMTPEQRRDALIQSVKDTLHSRFDKKKTR